MHNYYNTQYSAYISVGKPNNYFKFILDTGSGVTFIGSSDCMSNGCKTKENLYDINKARNWKSMHRKLDINFVSGYVEIEIGTDDFYFDNGSEPHPLNNLEFGVVTNEDGIFENSDFDGVIGLSYPSLADGTRPFFDRIIESKVLPMNIFSICYGRDPFKKDQSQFSLGGYDINCIENQDPSKIIWHEVVDKSWWTLKLDKVIFRTKEKGDFDTKLCQLNDDKKDCKIIIDSGSSIMASPVQYLSQFLKLLESYSDCDHLNKYPDIVFVINGAEYTLEPYEYVLSEKFQIDYEKKNGKKRNCAFGWTGFDIPERLIWIAGDIF